MAAKQVTRASIIAQFAKDIDKGIEYPTPEDISALRALVSACARVAAKRSVTWDDKGITIQGE